MTHARGIALLATMRFVRTNYGDASHERVLAALPEASRRRFGPRLRESAWLPLRDLATYSAAAQSLLAPNDPEFFRRLGRFVGTFYREHGGFAPMVAVRKTAIRLAPTLWRMLYDAGAMEIVQRGQEEAVIRILGMRTSKPLCETNCGAVEGAVGSASDPLRVEETACVLDGSPWCEMRLVWLRNS
jgi:hypothetical protein